jgi:outer membrane protein assembly factor BamB
MAYDIKTGKVAWNYTATQIGLESPYGNYPINIACIADGKIYLVSGEHSPTQPLWRGNYIRCINASNGVELWKILHWGAGIGGAHLTGMCVIMADGYVVGLNLYDNQIYCYGKGPSSTTVDAPMNSITAGDSAIIKGTVTDQSAGAKALAEKIGFMNGVAAVSDDSMEAWMEYLYAQQAMPNNATGVEVTLDALDPNGNFVHLGTVTSDTSGTYGYAWKTPDVPGKYTIVATFAGSKSYYSSYAETYAVVDEAPAPTTPPEYPQPIDNTMTILYATIAIIITIVIVGILMLRKK